MKRVIRLDVTNPKMVPKFGPYQSIGTRMPRRVNMYTESEAMRLYAVELAAQDALREVLDSGSFTLEEGLVRARAFDAAYRACTDYALSPVEVYRDR